MSDGDNERADLDQRFSLLEARAQKRRRASLVVTLVLVGITGGLVLRFARDIVDKQAELKRIENERVELDDKLRSEQEKLDLATRARKKLEAEVQQLEKTKKSYQERILGEKRVDDGAAAGVSPKNPHGQRIDPAAGFAPENAGHEDAPQPSEPLLIEEEGKAPPGFVMTPHVEVAPGRGASGRDIFKVRLWLDVPEDKRGDIDRVTYHLSPQHYVLKRLVEGGATPPFEARFSVFLCESTVLARAQLKNGATVAVDFDWCRHAAWPERKKEVVIVAPDEQSKPPANTTTQQPAITQPQPEPQPGILPGRR